MPTCKSCGYFFALHDWDDWEYWRDSCDDCEEIMSERSRKRAEWDAYHDEPCPEIELPPMPARLQDNPDGKKEE